MTNLSLLWYIVNTLSIFFFLLQFWPSCWDWRNMIRKRSGSESSFCLLSPWVAVWGGGRIKGNPIFLLFKTFKKKEKSEWINHLVWTVRAYFKYMCSAVLRGPRLWAPHFLDGVSFWLRLLGAFSCQVWIGALIKSDIKVLAWCCCFEVNI